MVLRFYIIRLQPLPTAPDRSYRALQSSIFLIICHKNTANLSPPNCPNATNRVPFVNK